MPEERARMDANEATSYPALRRLVQDLTRALGARLRSVVLYGSAARGEYEKAASDLNVILVLESLDPAVLEALAPASRRWRRAGQPVLRLFSPELIAESADAFPIEFLDIRASHVVLHGPDPFAGLEIRRDHLRLQCERELKEKLMRLREAYVEAHRGARSLRRLLAGSYPTFIALFRGCLRLLGEDAPNRNDEVVAAFCARAGLDRAPFEEVERLRRGDRARADLRATFARYHEALSRASRAMDRFQHQEGGSIR